MRFLIVTGMSGAGKSTALKDLEDFGYFCIDNLPVSLMVSFAKLLHTPDSGLCNVAVGIDIRNGQSLYELESTLEQFKELNYEYEILYLDCRTNILMKRYKETRRSHPLARHRHITDGIADEREKISFIRERADYIIDTSNLLSRELRAQLEKIFVYNRPFQNLIITIMSFGYKYGLPADADLVFDVRFLPNPYYIPELQAKTGNDAPVRDYVLSTTESLNFLEKMYDMLDFLIPHYIVEGKNSLVIAIGCTGGKHRSVTLANELYNQLQKINSVGVHIEHKDIQKNKPKAQD